MTTTITEDESRRATLLRSFAHISTDSAITHEMYHEDAILEFPQSAERFEGVHNFRTWREQYPGVVDIRLRRLVGSGPVWVAEVTVSYDGGPPMLGISVHEFDGLQVRRERIYVTEPWEAAAWREPWRSATPAE